MRLNSCARALAVIILLGVSTAASIGMVAAQEAPTPPNPAECAIPPRDLTAMLALLQATPVAGTPVGATPTGEGQVDDATVAAITTAIRGFVACTNAGDYPRYFAYWSDAFLQRAYAGASISAETLQTFATPVPATSGAELTIGDIGPMARLPDGRVQVTVITAPVYDASLATRGVFTWVAQGGEWRIDDLYDLDAATPAP